MNSKYASASIESRRTSRLCLGLIFIIIGVIFSFNPFSYYIGDASFYISFILIVIGIFIIIAVLYSKEVTFRNIPPTTVKTTKTRDSCPKCGARRSPGYALCLFCGYKFYPETKPISSISPQREDIKKSDYISPFPPISELLQSKGTSASEDEIPQLKKEVPDLTPSIQEKQKETDIKFCSQCGEKFLEDAKFCFICGKKREEVESILSDSELKKEEAKIASSPDIQPISQVSELKKEEAKISSSPDTQLISQASELKKEEAKITSSPDTQLISQASELKKEEAKIASSPDTQPIPQVSEEPLSITNEILEPIPPIPAKITTKRRIKPLTCKFCGIRLPKNTQFCLQCGMPIKSNE